jgi:ABC transporter substrate binding protein (PQQ-dependent alcohol dehydrogenase system)
LFNAGSIDDRLREEDCRANVIHAAPTRSMLADGLAQYLVWKQWKRWMLVVGSHAEDKLFAEALRRAASRFGAKIVQERVFEDTGGARRTDSGVTLIQRQMPVFTQQAPAYDVLVAADESEVFAPYLPYRTWDPRPVAGSAGLVPKSWDAASDQWGAVQMQNRFLKLNSRHMTALDMQAWTAARMIGEAVTRKNSGDPKSVLDFLHRRLQGSATDLAGLEPAASPADSAGGRPHGRIGLAAGRFPASSLGARHARRRPA